MTSIAEWNKISFERRMSSLDTQPQAAATVAPAYRQFDKDLVVSNEESPRVLHINRINLLEGKWDKGEDISDAYTIIDLLSIQSEAFPTSLETLDNDSLN